MGAGEDVHDFFSHLSYRGMIIALGNMGCGLMVGVRRFPLESGPPLSRGWEIRVRGWGKGLPLNRPAVGSCFRRNDEEWDGMADEVSGFEALFEEGAEDVGEEEDDDAEYNYGGGVGEGGEPASGRWLRILGAAVGEESDEVEHAEGEEDFRCEDCNVGNADEAGGDAVEGEDGAGDEEDAEGGVDEGEVIMSGVEGVVGRRAADSWAEDEEVVDSAADPGHGGDVVDPAHD